MVEIPELVRRKAEMLVDELEVLWGELICPRVAASLARRRPLNSRGLSIKDQIAVICATLRKAWVPVAADAGLETGADKARWRSEFIVAAWDELGQPCSAATVDRAVAFAASRADAFDPATAELIAGDAIARGQERCRYLSALTGVDRRAIWEWGFVERVSSGLYVTQLGEEQWGREFLDVADAWATVDA